MRKIYTLIITLLLSISAAAQLPRSAESVCPILIGSALPSITLSNIEGKSVDIKNIVDKKPSIIIFYRGGWCPYCNAHLSELGKVEADILNLGYQIIAISPDAINELNKTLDKNELRYMLLSDEGGKLAKAMGIAFKAPERYTKMLDKYSDGTNTGYLPVPSVFITDKKGDIAFEYVNPDYKTRLSSDMLLGILQALNKQNGEQ